MTQVFAAVLNQVGSWSARESPQDMLLGIADKLESQARLLRAKAARESASVWYNTKRETQPSYSERL